MFRLLMKVAIALVALYGAYVLYGTHAPPEWPRLDRLDGLLDSRPVPAVKDEGPLREPVVVGVSGPGLHRVICPTCEGEKRLSYADSRGANRVYPCPICNALGVRTVQVGPGQHICPDCLGMGVTERREARKSFGGKGMESRDSRQSARSSSTSDLYIRSSRCLRCNTSGVISTVKGTPPRATHGVQTPQPAR